MMGYYRQCIPDFADTSEPLVQLLHNFPFEWTASQQHAFETHKQKLKEAPILVYPYYNKEFILYTDAIKLAIGAIQAQLDDERVDHPVVYTSFVPKKHDKNYINTEKESLALLHEVKKLYHYVYSTHFIVVTDHDLLKWLQQLKEPEGRLARWALCLQGYSFTVLHCPGIQHQNADGLSRMPILALNPAKAD